MPRPDSVYAFLKRWWFIGAALFALGARTEHFSATVNSKANKADVEEIRNSVERLREAVNDMNARQQQFFCQDKPDWCR